MPAAPSTIQLIYFHAAELRLAIVAAAVGRIEPVEARDDAAGCPHIAALLKLPPSAPTTDRRLLVLTCAGRTARLIVDGPIQLTRIGARDLMPLGLGLRLPALLGFASDGEQLVLLLHIAWLVERASAHGLNDSPCLVEA